MSLISDFQPGIGFHFKNTNMKTMLLLFIAAFALISCSNQTQQTMSTTDNEQFVKQYFEHFNNHDFAKMANMYAETTDFKDPSLDRELLSRQGNRQ